MTEPRSSRLLGEIQQRKPFRSRSQEAVLGLLRTSDELHRHFSRVVEPSGVTLQQYNVLRILRGAGEEGLPTLSIGERMIERTPGVTRLVDRLAAKGWVARRRCEVDRRRVFCVLTPAGRELLAELEPPIDEADEVLARHLSERQLDTLIRLLDRIREGLDH